MRRRIASGAYITIILTGLFSGRLAADGTGPGQWHRIRYWGDIGYEYRTEATQGNKLTQHLVTTNINAATYLWRPWFATVKGGLGLSWNAVDRESDSGRRDIVSGNGRFSLLPVSRFPFEARFDRIDSRVTGELIGTPYVNTLWGLSQRYRSRSGMTNLMASYDRNLQEREQAPDYVNDLYRLGLSQRFGRQFLQVTGSRQFTTRQGNGNNNFPPLDRTEDNIYARHSYRPTPSLTFETIANGVDTDITGQADFNKRRYAQLQSYAYWRPHDKPMTASASLRYFQSETETGEQTSRAESLYGQAGLAYDMTRYLRLTGDATVTQDLVDRKRQPVSVQSLGILYHPAYLQFGRYSYNWNISETLRNRSGTEKDGQRLSGTLGHTLQHTTPLASGAQLIVSGSQSFNSEFDTATNAPHRLIHSASVTWRKRALARFYVSDSRTVGRDPEEIYQLISFRLGGSDALSRYASWTGNLSIQTVRQVTAQGRDTGFKPYATGALVYVHTRAFDVPRLRFTSDLQLNARALSPLPIGETDYQRSQWENRLDYLIGRLELRASIRLTSTRGQLRQLWLLRAMRRFGN